MCIRDRGSTRGYPLYCKNQTSFIVIPEKRVRKPRDKESKTRLLYTSMKREVLQVLAKVANSAAKRADGRASEFGMHQPKRPKKNKK